ncbi:hypothetical protein D9M72_528280 [compost metagenome]
MLNRNRSGAKGCDVFIQPLRDGPPHLGRICTRPGLEPHGQVARSSADGLEPAHPWRLLDYRAKRKRQDRDSATVSGPERNQVTCAAFDAYCRKGTATGARFRCQRYPVAEVVADQRLHTVGQVGDEHGVGGGAGRDRPVIRVHRFEDVPVRVDVECAVPALAGQGRNFGGKIAFGDAAAECRFDRFASGGGEVLAGTDRQDGPDP